MLGAKARAVASRRRAEPQGRDLPSAPPGHPARGRSQGRGRSPGSRVSALVPSSQGLAASVTYSWTRTRRLQLRGQRRYRTGFPLSSRSCDSRDHRPPDLVANAFRLSIGREAPAPTPVNSGDPSACPGADEAPYAPSASGAESAVPPFSVGRAKHEEGPSGPCASRFGRTRKCSKDRRRSPPSPHRPEVPRWLS